MRKRLKLLAPYVIMESLPCLRYRSDFGEMVVMHYNNLQHCKPSVRNRPGLVAELLEQFQGILADKERVLEFE